MADDDATARALKALYEMSDSWSAEVDAPAMAQAVRGDPNKILELLKQSFVEGAYRCFDDARNGRIEWLKVIQ